MVGSVKMWWKTVSTGFRLILAMLVASGMAAIALLFVRKRAQTAIHLKDLSQSRLTEVVSESEKIVAVHQVKVEQATEQAIRHEAAANALDARVQAARDKVAELRKELGR
jgi:ABC-type multidrug transport system fused ATPase/permease subunit